MPPGARLRPPRRDCLGDPLRRPPPAPPHAQRPLPEQPPAPPQLLRRCAPGGPPRSGRARPPHRCVVPPGGSAPCCAPFEPTWMSACRRAGAAWQWSQHLQRWRPRRSRLPPQCPSLVHLAEPCQPPGCRGSPSRWVPAGAPSPSHPPCGTSGTSWGPQARGGSGRPLPSCQQSRTPRCRSRPARRSPRAAPSPPSRQLCVRAVRP
mmetsp:Transcript_37433/g.95718  ORF Transcript_37433/g.95718 Transcript_37433/m.95718 type:complete len:206 (-) Transcript_37433:63-680(-)